MAGAGRGGLAQTQEVPAKFTDKQRQAQSLESREEGPGPRAHAARPSPWGPRLHSHPAHGTGTRPLPRTSLHPTPS